MVIELFTLFCWLSSYHSIGDAKDVDGINCIVFPFPLFDDGDGND